MKQIIGALFIILSTMSCGIAEEYHFVSIENLIEQEVGRLIIPEFYKKLGIKITISPKPGKRAQLMASTGNKDGEIMRIWTYGNETPTTIRVPTPYYQLETMPFIRKGSDVEINSKSDLKKYRIAKVRGVKHTDNITRGLTEVSDFNSTKKMMQIFKHRASIDVALTNTIDGIIELNRLGVVDIIPLKRPLATLDLYHYIHNDHAELVPRIDSVIKEMKSNGELKALIKKAEKIVIGKHQNK
jgi:polar amino acid transport system substrate-binding protein